MEFMGQPRTFGAGSLLEVPGFSPVDIDDDEGEVGFTIRPKCSPLPRRRSSDSDSEPEPPFCGSRRVSFADAKGLSLVQVKEFDTRDVPKLPGYSSSEGEGKEAEEYFLSPLTFSLPLSLEELFIKVRDQKVELETIELLPGTTILKGVIRVLNISFNKAVYIRTTLDSWSSHFDLLAEYIPGSSDGLMDCFSFRLTLVPPFGKQGARVDFCLRYETPVGTFWSNNDNRNYVLFCQQRKKDKPHAENVNKKSCLKTVSQNFSVENISAAEASSQENLDMSKNREEVNVMKAQQISAGQSGTSEEDQQKIQAENRRNSSRRNRRKAARLARVKDYFAQRGGGANDTERDKGAKQEAQEESPKEKHSDVQPFAAQLSPFLSESLETCSESLPGVPHDASPAHNSTSSNKPEKCESSDLAGSATSAGGESATVIPDDPLLSNDEPAFAERRNINKAVSRAEGESQRQGASHECANNAAAGPADGVISAVISESLVSPTNSFTFGTVVAPLYHQMFGRVGSESQSVGDWGSPALNVGDLPQSYTEREESGVTSLTDVRNNEEKVQGNLIKSQESNYECFNASPNSPPTEEHQASLRATADDILDRTETLQDPGEVTESDQRRTNTSEDTEVHPHAVNILHTELLSAQIPTQSLCLQGEGQEDSLTCDLQNQTAAETAQAQLPENSCSQIKTNPDETLSQAEPEVVTAGQDTSLLPLQPPQRESELVSDETEQQSGGETDFEWVESTKDDDTITILTTNASSEADNLLASLHDLNPNQITNSATEETASSSNSCCETVEEKDFSTAETSPETQEETNNVEEQNTFLDENENNHSAETEASGDEAESMTEAVISNHHIQDDMFAELKDEDTVKDEPAVSEKMEHHEMEAAVLKQMDFSSTDTTEEKNWEMMVEEEEKNMLTHQEESEAINLKADTETMEKDQGGQLEDAGSEIENRDATEREKEKAQEEEEEEEVVEKLTAAGENGTKAEDAVGSEDGERDGEGDILEIVAEKDMEVIEKQPEHVQATKTKKTGGVEEVAEETEAEKREEQKETELKEEKYFVEVQEVNIGAAKVREEQEIEGEEKMEIVLTDGDDASVAWRDQLKPREENIEEGNLNYKDEILVDKAAAASEFVDAGSEGRAIGDGEDEVGCLEERLDITQNKGEDSLSAPVNSVQDERVIDKENTRKGGGAHREEDFQSSEDVTHDRSRAENDSVSADGDSCVSTDEPENDQTSLDSASESDSDDEVELYMHCLRAVHTGAQATKDRAKDPGFSVGKRPSISRGKLLSTPMPSITESLDEEQHLSCLQDTDEDLDAAEIQPAAAAQSLPSEEESINRNVSWWKETFSCSNISKTLFYTTLLVVFLVVAYHYDFLACFGLYLVSVVWLYCQGERQPAKNNNRIG